MSISPTTTGVSRASVVLDAVGRRALIGPHAPECGNLLSGSPGHSWHGQPLRLRALRLGSPVHAWPHVRIRRRLGVVSAPALGPSRRGVRGIPADGRVCSQDGECATPATGALTDRAEPPRRGRSTTATQVARSRLKRPSSNSGQIGARTPTFIPKNQTDPPRVEKTERK